MGSRCERLRSYTLLLLYSTGILHLLQGVLSDNGAPLAGAAKVQLVTELPGVQFAKTEEDMEYIFRKSLYEDLAPWNRQSPLNVTTFLQFVARVARNETHLNPKYIVLVVVQDTHVYGTWLQGSGPPNGYYHRWPCTFTTLVQVEKKLPDTMFLYNVRDYPACPPGQCPIPAFSHFKWWSLDPSGRRDQDILLPQTNHVYTSMFTYDWGNKTEAAFFRGGGQCATAKAGGCTRLEAWRASLADPASLDVGIVSDHVAVLDERGPELPPVTILELKPTEMATPIPLSEHARWKYLLSMDGYTSSARLWKIMAMNSVVLKEESGWVDSYSRALVDGEHYVLWRNHNGSLQSLKDAVTRLRADDTLAQNISTNGQQFLYRYRHKWPQAVYHRHAVVKYAALFDESMAAYVKALKLTVGEPKIPEVREAILQSYMPR